MKCVMSFEVHVYAEAGWKRSGRGVGAHQKHWIRVQDLERLFLDNYEGTRF